MSENNSLRKISKFDDSNTNTVNIYSTDKNISPKEELSQAQQNPNYTSIQNTSGDLIKNESCFSNKKKLFIIIGIIIGLLVIGVVVLCVFVIGGGSKGNPPEQIIPDPPKPPEIINPNETDNNNEIPTPINPIQTEKEHIDVEFQFKTEVKDLKSINVIQKYTEKVITNGVESVINHYRNTNYQIFFSSAKNSSETNKNNYDKLFTGVILINSQCVTFKNETCTPNKIIDFTKVKKSNMNSSLRYLDEFPDFKDLPVPLCLFNITDNDVITSMTCPEKLQTSIKQNMILDLYFFRPPAIKRPDKIGSNITLNKWKEGDKYYIRESDGGICDIPDSFNTFCYTDMNTTTDINGTLLTYDELSVTNIMTNDENSYHKIKTTNLKDQSEELENVDKIVYEEVLNNMISKLEPYMVYKEEFSDEEFKEMYNVSKNITNNVSKRNLQENEKNIVVTEENLMNIEHYAGVNVKLNMKNDIGLNVASMKAFLNFFADDSKKEISNLQEYSNITAVLNKLIILSKSGNENLLELYNQINERLENITTTVSNNLTSLINNLVYNDLSDIFDSTMSLENLMNLPISILVESSSLKNKLDSLLTNITNGGMKNNIKILNTDVYDYIQRSHILVNNIFKNINNLTHSLNSSKSKLTEISTYFTNNTPSSFLGTIEEAEQILMNYYKNEKNLILEKMQEPLNLFEKKIKESLTKEEKLINNLYSKLENNQTNLDGNEEDLKNLKLNIYNVKNYVSEIISKGKEKLLNELDLKDSTYFVSNYDIKINNDSYTQSIESGKTIAAKLDNDDSIDKSFINTMDNFKNSYTNILTNMEKIKNEQFPLIDDALNGSVFNEQVKKSFDLNALGIDVFNEIRNENDKYLDDFNNIVTDFLNKNKKDLDELFLKLTLLFSEDSLKDLANNLNVQFNDYTKKFQSNVANNKNLATNYLQKMKNLIHNNTYILEHLKNIKHDDPNYPYYLSTKKDHEKYLKEFVDSINSKIITNKYITKYTNFKNNQLDSLEYIKKELYVDFKNEYQSLLNKIKESLHKVKNTKISDIYPDFPELDFIENNINLLKGFYDKLNKHISDVVFNNFYYPKINEFKNNQINFNKNYSDIIDQNYNSVKSSTVQKNFQNDFCVNFLRKRTYTCKNGRWTKTYPSNYDYCFPLNAEANNYAKLVKISTNCKPKLSINKFYTELNTIVNSYNSKIQTLKQNLLNLQNNVLKNNNVTEKLGKIKTKVQNILNENYGDTIINNTYQYFKQMSNERITNIFGDLENKFNNLYTSLKTDISTNLDNYKYSINEFKFKTQLIQQLFLKNISNNFYDSIISHQKMEFNYTISYYYNYLYKNINSTYQLILSRIPENKKGLDVILKNRKNSLNSIFSEIIQMLLNSKNSTLNLNSQIYLLEIPETNFFQTNSILVNSQINLNNSLNNITKEISTNGKANDEYGLTLKYYLENSENGKQINDFYEEINNQVFVYLNFDKFQETILNNWIFDQDDFIKKLNSTLYNSNLEISKQFNLQKENYEVKLNEILSKIFTKDDIIHKINDLFSTSYKTLAQNDINQISQNVQNVIQKVKDNLIKEQQRIETLLVSYNKDFTIINKTINDYKKNIFSTVNKTIFSVLEQIHNNIYTKYYVNYIEHYLNMFYQNVSLSINEYKPSILLNSTYNIKDSIFNIVNELIENYKYISKTQIINKYNEFYQNIYNQINVKNIQNNIIQQIDQQFNTFYSSLKNIATHEIGNNGYVAYDFSDKIKNEIDNSLQTSNNNINSIIQKTKGDNFNFDEKKFIKLDFTRINDDLAEIKKTYDKFINKQKINEENELDQFLQKILKLNFNNLLNNLIPSFGNDFFERIIFYNKNFKIEGLYNNLIYGLSESLSYYITLLSTNSIKALTKDLKMKIFSLNNLDDVIKTKNEEILKLLNLKVDEFINQSGLQISNKYLNYITNDTSIELAYDENIKKLIKKNSNIILPDIKDYYNNLLNEFLKEKIINSYKKVLNSKSEETYVTIKNQREFVKAYFDDLFSLDPDEVLNDINIKLNNTKNAIKEYVDYFNTFKINQDLLNYVENFGNVKIKPLYEKFLSFMNELTKHQIVDNIETNAQNYENSYKKETILKFLNDSLKDIKNNYINPMNNSINNYGIDDYANNLNAKINQKTLRLLQNNENENLYEKKVADKSIDETFHKLLNNSNNVNNFINTLEKFDEFETKIQKNIENLNSAYKSTKNLIIKNEYQEEIDQLVTNKLEHLNNLTLDYYNQINENYLQLKNYLKSSIQEIDNLLNLCANKTFSTFVDKYYEISNETQNKDNVQEEEEIDENIFEESLRQNTQYYTKAIIKNLKKKAKFKFEFNFDEINNLKMPKVYAHVINLSKPKKIDMQIYSNLDECSKNVDAYEVEFQNVNYTLVLDFNTDSNDIITTVVTDFDAYQISEERYTEGKKIGQINCDINNPLLICISETDNLCNHSAKEEVMKKSSKTVEKRNYTNVIHIPN